MLCLIELLIAIENMRSVDWSMLNYNSAMLNKLTCWSVSDYRRAATTIDSHSV